MNAINSAVQLSQIRSKIDSCQQLISKLEQALQEAILGSPGNKATLFFGQSDGTHDGTSPVADTATATNGYTSDSVYGIYKAMDPGLATAFEAGVENFSTDEVDQTLLRQMLYQARALLGELRVEEQQWNQEVNQEKERRKDLSEFAKG